LFASWNDDAMLTQFFYYLSKLATIVGFFGYLLKQLL